MSEDVISDSKLMVLFTDGETNSDSSIVPMSDIIRKALDNNINIVTVAFGSHLSKEYLENIPFSKNIAGIVTNQNVDDVRKTISVKSTSKPRT